MHRNLPQPQQDLQDSDWIYQDTACSPPQPDIHSLYTSQWYLLHKHPVTQKQLSSSFLALPRSPRDQEKQMVETMEQPWEPESSVEEDMHHPQQISHYQPWLTLGCLKNPEVPAHWKRASMKSKQLPTHASVLTILEHINWRKQAPQCTEDYRRPELEYNCRPRRMPRY